VCANLHAADRASTAETGAPSSHGGSAGGLTRGSRAYVVLERQQPFVFVEPAYEHLDFLWATGVATRAFPAVVALLARFRHRQVQVARPRQPFPPLPESDGAAAEG
jgi:hypothetical protein